MNETQKKYSKIDPMNLIESFKIQSNILGSYSVINI